MATEIFCFYHANCTDGAAAAAVIKRKHPGAQCFAMNHGDPIPIEVAKKRLFIVDFSFDPETLQRLKEKASEVRWYDHHKTAVPTRQQLGWGIVELSESGASLAWKQEFPDQPL